MTIIQVVLDTPVLVSQNGPFEESAKNIKRKFSECNRFTG